MPRTITEILEEMERLREKCRSLYEEHCAATAEFEQLKEELRTAQQDQPTNAA